MLPPQYGARVRFGIIITEAELEPDQKLEKSICNKCGKCVNGCPAGALSEWEKHYEPATGWRMDKKKCYHYYCPKFRTPVWYVHWQLPV